MKDKENDRIILKECPWCSCHRMFSLIKDGDNYPSFQVKCESCGSRSPYELTETEARERWNKKVSTKISQDGWIEVKHEKPKALRRVLGAYRSYDKLNYIVVVAQYTPPKTIHDTDFLDEEWWSDSDITEYDEEKDIYYVVEGWWEISLEAEINYQINEKMEYWMPLPKGPQ